MYLCTYLHIRISVPFQDKKRRRDVDESVFKADDEDEDVQSDSAEELADDYAEDYGSDNSADSGDSGDHEDAF